MNIAEIRGGTRVKYLKDFKDARGYPWREGDEDLILGLEGDSSAGFTLLMRDGPPMRASLFGPNPEEYLHLFDIPPLPGPPALGSIQLPPWRRKPFEEVPAPVEFGAGNLHETIGRAAALFANGEKEQAIAEMKQINAIPDRTGYLYQEIAKILGAVANRQPTMEGFEWLWDEAFSNWYAWGSGATSGGEGTERGRHIKQAHRDYESAKAERERFDK